MTSRAHHALVLADGPVDAVADLDWAWPGWSDGIDLVVAADGGARHAAALGRRIEAYGQAQTPSAVEGEFPSSLTL